MKRISFLIIFLLFVSVAHADSIFYDTNTKEVFLIANPRNVILSNEDKARLTIVPTPDKFDITTLTRPVTDYLYSRGSIVLNTDKIIAQDNAKIDEVKALEKIKSDKQSAIAKLTAVIQQVDPKYVLTAEEMKALLGG